MKSKVLVRVVYKGRHKITSHVFYNLSGLQITYDMSKPSGQRVASIKVRCASCRVPIYKPLDKDEVYKVILPSNLAQGKGGFNVIRQKKLSHKKGDVVEFEAVMNYFKAKSPIMTGVENRINFIDEDKTVISNAADALLSNLRVVCVAISFSVIRRFIIG